MAYGTKKTAQAPAGDVEKVNAIEVGKVSDLPAPFSARAIVFSVTDQVIAEIREAVKDLKIGGVEDKEGYQKVKTARLKIVRLRGELESSRKVQKQDALDFGRNLDTEAARLRTALETIEAPLEKMEDEIDALVQAERDRIQREKDAKHQAREEAAVAVGVAITFAERAKIVLLTDEEFSAYLAEATVAFEAKQKKEREDAQELERLQKEEAARKAAADAKEAQDKADEEARLKKQREDQDAAQAELDKQAKALADKEDELKRQQDKLAADQRLEQARKDGEAKAAADLKARQEQEAKDKADQEERDREIAARQEALRPDKEKLAAYFAALRAVPVPIIEDPRFKDLLEKFLETIQYK